MSADSRLSQMSEYEVYQFVKAIVFRSLSLSIGISESDSKLLELISEERSEFTIERLKTL